MPTSAEDKQGSKYVELCDEYKKVLWGRNTPVGTSMAESRILGKELTLVERFNLIATNPAFEPIRTEVLKNSLLGYQSPETVDMGSEARSRRDELLATTDLGREALKVREKARR